MNKKSILFLSIFTLTAVAITGGVLWYANEVKKEAEMAQKQVEETKQEKKFIVDVDMNVENWQTKETEFFTIKFPKEWYWMESDREKTGYYSQVITNNPNFDINENADIGVFTRGRYPLILQNNTEVIITTSNLGDATSNGGTPFEYMESEIKRVKEVYPYVECEYATSFKNIPLTVYCFFIDNDNKQRVDTYYTSYTRRTFSYTARTNMSSDLELEDILEKIALSLIQKKDF